MSLRIQRINPSPKKGWFNIELTGGKKLTVSAAGIAKFRLAVDKRLAAKEVEEIDYYTSFYKSFERAVRLISFRPRSEKEIRLRLGRQQVSSELVEKVIEKLTREGLLDDEMFARWWCEQRIRFRPCGRRRLEAELCQKGLKPRLITFIMDQLVNEEVLLKKILAKKYLPLPKGRRDQQRVFQALLRRGFAWETIKKVIRKTDVAGRA